MNNSTNRVRYTVCKPAITKYLKEVKFPGSALPVHLTRTNSTQTFTIPPPLRGFAITLTANTHTHSLSLSLSLSVVLLWKSDRSDAEIYLTTHNTHKRQTLKTGAGLLLTTAVSERPQTHALDLCFSTFVRPRPSKFFFHKTRTRSQQIYS